ncbi:hypothetical protein SALBM311S_10751 [Streptomyces alboniger]
MGEAQFSTIVGDLGIGPTNERFLQQTSAKRAQDSGKFGVLRPRRTVGSGRGNRRGRHPHTAAAQASLLAEP